MMLIMTRHDLRNVLLLFLCMAMLALPANAQAVRVFLPDSMTGLRGDSVDLPVLISGQAGDSIISADITICFREAVLTGTTVCRCGNAAPGWTAFANPLPCTVLLAAMGADPLVAGETLLVLRMRVDAIDTTTVWFARCKLNEGQVACTTSEGKFRGQAVGVEERPVENCPAHGPSIFASAAAGSFTVQLPESPAHLQLLDVMGRCMKNLWVRGPSVRLSGVAPGAYFLRIETPKGLETRKVVLTE